jgi:hypothetical protein
MDFFLFEIAKIWQKSQDSWFADFFSSDFKNPYAAMDFPKEF